MSFSVVSYQLFYSKYMLLSKRKLTQHLHGTLLPDQVARDRGYAITRKIIRAGLSKYLATPRHLTSRETIAGILSGTDECSVGEKIAYAAYCSFMQQYNIVPKLYSSWRRGNGVINETPGLRRSTKSRWLQIRDKKITVGSIVTRSPDPKMLLRVASIGSDCMVIVSHPNQTSTFSITPVCLVKITDPAKHPLFNTIA